MSKMPQVPPRTTLFQFEVDIYPEESKPNHTIFGIIIINIFNYFIIALIIPEVNPLRRRATHIIR